MSLVTFIYFVSSSSSTCYRISLDRQYKQWHAYTKKNTFFFNPLSHQEIKDSLKRGSRTEEYYLLAETKMQNPLAKKLNLWRN